MRARVIVTDAPPEIIEAGAQMTRDVLVPASRAQGGYRGYLALYDRSTGRSLAITLWEDETSETLSDDASRERRDEAAKAFGANIVSVDKYDVAIAELA